MYTCLFAFAIVNSTRVEGSYCNLALNAHASYRSALGQCDLVFLIIAFLALTLAPALSVWVVIAR